MRASGARQQVHQLNSTATSLKDRVRTDTLSGFIALREQRGKNACPDVGPRRRLLQYELRRRYPGSSNDALALETLKDGIRR